MGLYDEENEVVEAKKEKKPMKVVVPSGYIEIKYTSLGKLTTPAVLHFRDFSLEEIQDLAWSDDTNNMTVLINSLNKMVFEGYDCGHFTIKELLKTVYTIQAHFYSKFISKQYYIDADIEDDEELNDPKNIIVQDIDLKDFNFKLMDDEFQEPMTLKDPKSDTTITCRLQRIKDVVDINEYLLKKYQKEEMQFRHILKKAQKLYRQVSEKRTMEQVEEELNKEFGVSEYDKAIAYVNLKTKEMSILLKALVLEKFGKKKLNTIDEKIKVLSKISGRLWTKYDKICDKYDYGLQEEVTFYSTQHQDKITRRLPLQVLELIPFDVKDDDNDITVQFG